MAQSTVDDLISKYNSGNDEVEQTHKKSANFLRILKAGFNEHLGNNPSVLVDISNPVYKFEENFPVSFDLALTMKNGNSEKTFILPCTAMEMNENIYLINDSLGQHTFYLDGNNAEKNFNAFTKLASNFAKKFEKHENLNIDINKK